MCNSDFEELLNYQDHRLPLVRIDLRFQSNQKENTYEKLLNIHIATNNQILFHKIYLNILSDHLILDLRNTYVYIYYFQLNEALKRNKWTYIQL